MNVEPPEGARAAVRHSAVAASGLLAACGGGHGDDSGTTRPATSSRFTRPADANQAARFLAQATMGAARSDIEALQATSYAAWIDAQVDVQPLKGYYDFLAGPNGAFVLSGAGDHAAAGDVWRKMISSPDALRQRMVHALAEIFVVYETDGPGPYIYMNFLDRLEQLAFGNFRDILQSVTLSLAMAKTLTYLGNLKEDPTTGCEPDENYAREVMQLFTIGLYQLNADGSLVKDASGATIPTYDVPDVRGLARVFTGWFNDNSALPAGAPSSDVAKRDLVQQPQHHELGVKQFLGTTIPAGTDGAASLKIALDTLYNHPNVGPFIGRQLIQRLVTSNPSPVYIARVAAAFADNGLGVRGDMKAVVKAVLLDDEARDPEIAAAPTFGKLREPMIRFVNWARGWKAASYSGWWGYDKTVHQFWSNDATSFNQCPLRSPSVFNFFRPSYVPPTTSIAAAGLVAPEFQITNEVSVAGFLNTMAPFISSASYIDIRADYSSLIALAVDSAALLAEVNLVLAAGQVGSDRLAGFKTAIDTIKSDTDTGKTNRVTAAITLMLASPEYVVQK